MNHAPRRFRSAFRAIIVTGLAAQGAVRAQDLEVADTSGWFVRAGAVARFNIKASISTVLPATGPGIYDDGFVRPDSGGTASGTTWNWGYNAATRLKATSLCSNVLMIAVLRPQDVNVSNPLLGEKS
jgi:hypothetical protein